MDADIDLRQTNEHGLIARAFGTLENATGAFIFAVTMVTWTVVLDSPYLIFVMRRHAVLGLSIWCCAFALFEAWDYVATSRQVAKKEGRLAERRILQAAASRGGRLTHLEASLACPLLSLDEARATLRDFSSRGHCTPSEEEEDVFLFPGLQPRVAARVDSKYVPGVRGQLTSRPVAS